MYRRNEPRYTITYTDKTALITLANNQGVVTLDPGALATILGPGLPLAFYLNGDRRLKRSYARTTGGGGDSVSVAREITKASLREHVHHRNGDETDYRRVNLVVCPGRRCGSRCAYYRRKFRGSLIGA